MLTSLIHDVGIFAFLVWLCSLPLNVKGMIIEQVYIWRVIFIKFTTPNYAHCTSDS